MARAERSGIRLSADDASLVKGMAKRGDRHHDIAADFGVNQGRIAEVLGGEKHAASPVAPSRDLPEAGPYITGRSSQKTIAALEQARSTLRDALNDIESALADLQKGD